MHPLISAAGYVSLGALVAWRMHVRFRRLLKRQRLSKYRAPVTLVIYPLLVLLVVHLAWAQPLHLFWYALALAGGAVLGVLGLRLTKFEAVAGRGLFYTPHAPLGVVLLLVFVARIVFRLVEVFVLAPAGPRSHAEFIQSPWTLLAFGLFAGYSICYAIGLLRWRAKVFRLKQARERGQGRP